MSKLRKDDTPEGKKIWDAVDKAAARAPEWLKDALDTCLIIECNTFEEIDEKLGHLTETALTVLLPPNLAGPVPEDFVKTYPLWDVGVLGWEGTRNECLCWTAEQAVFKITKAVEMGYDPIFRPPSGVWDRELLMALEEMLRAGVELTVVNNPGTKPSGPTLKFFPGSSDRHCSIVNVSEEIVNIETRTYRYPRDLGEHGVPYATE